MQLHFSLILTPLLTGFVGYFTNYLAIKMLFRPHKKRWYSFGWQGVIPRNRNKLAREIGRLVGNELIQEDDILRSIKNEHFQAILSEFIRKELRRFFVSSEEFYLGDLLKRFDLNLNDILDTIFDKLFKDPQQKIELQRGLEQLIQTIAKELSDKRLKDIELNFGSIFEKISNNLIKNGDWQKGIVNNLRERLYDGLYSGKSIADILPQSAKDKIFEISPIIAEKLIHFLRQLLNDPIIKIKITRKIIDWKNSYFGNSFFDQLKLGVLNVFLSEEKISELVENELPKVLNAIIEDKAMFDNVKNGLSEQINTLINKPLYYYVEFFGINNVHTLINKLMFDLEAYLRGENFSKFIIDFLSNSLEKYKDQPLKEISSNIGLDIHNFLKNIINLEMIYNKKSHIIEILANAVAKFSISSVFRDIKEETYEKIADKIKEEINLLLDRNIPEIVRNLNIPGIVEQRINSLNLYQVEGLLFSFMADQFQWINILGFILGFIFGMIQSIFIFFYGG